MVSLSRHCQQFRDVARKVCLLNLRPHKVAYRLSARQNDLCHEFILKYRDPALDRFEFCLYNQL